MDNNFLRQRRNLMAISIGLLLFIFAEGDIKTLFGIKLGNEDIAIGLAWLAFFYATWRYYLYFPKNLSKSFDLDIVNALKTDASYQKNARKALKKYRNISDEILDSINTPVSSYFIKENGKYHYHISTHEQFQGGNIPCENHLLTIKILIRNWLLPIFKGKVFSDYFIPVYIAEITFFVGLNQLYNLLQVSTYSRLLEYLSFALLIYLIFILFKKDYINA